MAKVIKIGDKELNFKASALTSMAYKKLFKEDILKSLGELDPKTFDASKATDTLDTITRLAFIMNRQAEGTPVKDLMNLNEIAYYEWIDQFNFSDLYDSNYISEVLSVWTDGLQTSTKAKN